MVSFRERLQQPFPILFDGAMGTLLYQQGVFVNRSFEEVCLSNPSQIQSIHDSYIDAGAEVIETNTFGANAFVLAQYGLETKIAEINKVAVQLAKSAAKNRNVYVAGSIGQVYSDALHEIDLNKVYKPQIDSLVTAGVDLLCVETFSDMKTLKHVITLIRTKYDIPIIALVSIDTTGKMVGGLEGKAICRELNTLNVDMVGFNCSVGPKVMAEFLLSHASRIQKPLCVMPNAGETHQVAGRHINLFTEDYFAKYVKRFVEMGVTGIGGCCGIHPNHIGRAYETLKTLFPTKPSGLVILDTSPRTSEAQKSLPPCSNLHRSLAAQEFVLSVEITAPKGMSSEKTLHTIQRLADMGLKHINVPDGPRASSRMSALLFVLEVIKKVKIEPILHYCLRDKNMLAILGELLAVHTHGLRNLLVITGDPPKVGNYPTATAVFDFDSVGLLKLLDNFNRGNDFAGNAIEGFAGNYCVGSGFNHAALNIQKEIDRMQKKMDAGAQYIVSQPVFSVSQFENFMEAAHQQIRNCCPILTGVWPFASLRNALFLKENVPGVEIEDAIITRLSKYTKGEDQQKAGQDIAIEVCQALIPMVRGISLSAPFNKFEVIEPVIRLIQGTVTK